MKQIKSKTQVTSVDFADLTNKPATYAPTIGTTSTTALAGNGTAAAATKLATARNIGGVSFNGTEAINLPGVNTAGNQSTSGNAATATKLATARTISLTGGVTGGGSFDGSGNVAMATLVGGSYVITKYLYWSGTNRQINIQLQDDCMFNGTITCTRNPNPGWSGTIGGRYSSTDVSGSGISFDNLWSGGFYEVTKDNVGVALTSGGIIAITNRGAATSYGITCVTLYSNKSMT